MPVRMPLALVVTLTILIETNPRTVREPVVAGRAARNHRRLDNRANYSRDTCLVCYLEAAVERNRHAHDHGWIWCRNSGLSVGLHLVSDS